LLGQKGRVKGKEKKKEKPTNAPTDGSNNPHRQWRAHTSETRATSTAGRGASISAGELSRIRGKKPQERGEKGSVATREANMLLMGVAKKRLRKEARHQTVGGASKKGNAV